ncbi:hypothetical protein [Cytobacillus horneckiae]|uniref:hypothetical protein n=1 Tax=Cytobacillus horneckiae TaxID=549687 RepID=UPI003D250A46
MKRRPVTNEERARETLKKMISGFSKVMTPQDMLLKAWWFDFAGAIHNQELTERIMKEELNI